MMNFTDFCEARVLHLIDQHRAILTVLDILVLLGNAVANTLVIYILLKTEEITKFSYRLMFLLSANDLAIASIAQTLFITYIYMEQIVLYFQYISWFADLYLVFQVI